MNIIKESIHLIGITVALFVHSLACGQGSFQNLDFEQANPVIVVGSPLYPYAVTAASALPYWTVVAGGNQLSVITENDPSTGSAWVSLVAAPGAWGYVPLDGNYSVLIQGGGLGASISQTGLIPSGTESLLFDAMALPDSGSMAVYVGTQSVALSAVGSGPNYTIYGANISAWAGETEQLTFEVPGYSGNWEFDDIQFSTAALTPEPSPVALTALSGLLFGARMWLARRE
jgi:hypothetical protein